MKIKTGIFFGGPSREREIAFAGGRTVYDNLNKTLFEPIPVFVDSHRNFILLDWQYVYKGTIRDFYPPVSELPADEHGFQVYIESLGEMDDETITRLIEKVGRRVSLSEIKELIDVAFLALHGVFGEDGQIQGLLESIQIPYTGSGIKACAIGMDKAFQKKVMEAGGFDCPPVMVLEKEQWSVADTEAAFNEAKQTIGFPMVIRPANQGSSIGVKILPENAPLSEFTNAINAAFFRTRLTATEWQQLSDEQRITYLRELTDIRSGVGFPLEAAGTTFYHPATLLNFLNQYFEESQHRELLLAGHLSEQRVIVEGFIEGKEFSCIVLKKENGTTVALPPTEIVKGGEVFDYRSKYLPGQSRKITPIDLPVTDIEKIRTACQHLFDFLEFNTYARIDGFITKDKTVLLNDPNTTSGMLPSSFFFHQAAEIGLNPSQFLTYIIRISIQERLATSMDQQPFAPLLLRLDNAIEALKNDQKEKQKIAVILGGYSFERHISVESGRNIFEKLASSDAYEPIPVFLTGNSGQHELYQIPINLLLKDNADDIRDKIHHYKKHPVIEKIKTECADITRKYASKAVVFSPKPLTYETLKGQVDGVFIALHGRPGEDGSIQREFDRVGLPYNGSSYASSQITINKFDTLQTLRKHGFTTTEQALLSKKDFLKNTAGFINRIEQDFQYPFIAKPVDDGCSSAVKLIKNREVLSAYLNALFREKEVVEPTLREILDLLPKEEFPQKEAVLIEELISAEGAAHFMEVTGGLLTHHKEGEIVYEMFEPSEALAGGEILSLEEKFLAGEGQNITPARFADNEKDYHFIAEQVKTDLKRAAKILNIRGYARIDAFVRIFADRRVETIIIEVNSLPGMTPATCIFHQSAINGYKPYDFINQILQFGFADLDAVHQ